MKENKNFVKGSHKENNYKYAPKGLMGIYYITHDKSNHFYIGSSTDIGRRLSHHFGHLRRNVHICKKLQELYSNSNYEDFSFNYKIYDDEVLMRKDEISLLEENHSSVLLLNSGTINGSWINNEGNKETIDSWKLKIGEYRKTRIGDKNNFYGKKAL